MTKKQVQAQRREELKALQMKLGCNGCRECDEHARRRGYPCCLTFYAVNEDGTCASRDGYTDSQ